MLQNLLWTKPMLTLSSPFVITLPKLILTSSSHIWKAPELDVVSKQLPETMLWLQNQMRAVLDSSTLRYWTLHTRSINRKYPPASHPFIIFVVAIIKRHTQSAAAVIKAFVSDQLGNWRNRTFGSNFSLTLQGTPLYGTLLSQAFTYTQQKSWQHNDRSTRLITFFFNSTTFWLHRNDRFLLVTWYTRSSSRVKHSFSDRSLKRDEIMGITNEDKALLQQNITSPRLPQSCGSLTL